MKISVKFYTDVTGFSVRRITEIAGNKGWLEEVGSQWYIVEVI